jgi:hypothetical protein
MGWFRGDFQPPTGQRRLCLLQAIAVSRSHDAAGDIEGYAGWKVGVGWIRRAVPVSKPGLAATTLNKTSRIIGCRMS